MTGLAMVLKQVAPGLDVPGLLKQFETLKAELPNFARGVKNTVESTDKRLAALETSHMELHTKVDHLTDVLLQVLAAPKDEHIYPAGKSRTPEEMPYNDGTGL